MPKTNTPTFDLDYYAHLAATPSPDCDALTGGRWVPNGRGVVVWEGYVPQEVTRGKTCRDCDQPAGSRRVRCTSCATKMRRNINRNHMRRTRAEKAA